MRSYNTVLRICESIQNEAKANPGMVTVKLRRKIIRLAWTGTMRKIHLRNAYKLKITSGDTSCSSDIQ
jgi:hypothetical protein